MNYERLFSFVAFAEDLNFTRAAERLNISQPALHVQVKKLTDEIGHRLYVKEGRQLRLTQAGERLVRFGRRAQREGDDLRAELNDESAGTTTLAAGAGALLYLLGSAMRRFVNERYPLQVETLRGPDALAALESGRADIAVGARWRPGPGCRRRALAKHGFVLAVPKGHQLASRTSVTLRDLKDERLILPPNPSQHRDLITTQLDTLRVPWKLGVEAPGWQLMLHLVQSKLGVAVVNDFCTMPRTVHAIPLGGLPAIQYEVCTAKGALRPGTRRFLELLD